MTVTINCSIKAIHVQSIVACIYYNEEIIPDEQYIVDSLKSEILENGFYFYNDMMKIYKDISQTRTIINHCKTLFPELY